MVLPPRYPLFVDAGATTPEAGPADIEAGAEAAVDASTGRCNPTAPFADALPQLVAPESQTAAWLTEDELVVLLSRNTPDASFDLYSARRPFVTEDFSAPELVMGVNDSTTEDDNPTLTRDGLRLFFHSRRTNGVPPGNRLHLFVAKRMFPNVPFEAPVPVGGLPTVQSDQVDPFVAPDGNTLYFVSHGEADAAAFDRDLWVAQLGSDSAVTAVTALTALNTPSFEVNPILTADEKIIYFSSNRSMGQFDIYRASRASRTDDFGPPERVAELSTASLVETPTWVSADDCEVWIARESGANGNRAIYRLRRPR